MSEQRLYGSDGGIRKPARFSQCDKIMRVLSDGKPHLVSEIHALAGYSRLNSRVSELRKRGYDIQSFHLAGKSGSEGYGYQLVGSLTERDQGARLQLCSEDPCVVPHTGSTAELGAAESPPSSASSEQLSLVAS